ncbi:hypothetical protein B0H65DRAFT_204693 [Neurospora tetraspora]|uniref:Uncharacterized protein n=1 Tax=Neurospora tetraspora TaxID=94610 RepID=A0AAE0MT95_9PEZI|nr:hypothetical protein B0H65DRAFT_204693 [Neurospora tetraspora]
MRLPYTWYMDCHQQNNETYAESNRCTFATFLPLSASSTPFLPSISVFLVEGKHVVVDGGDGGEIHMLSIVRCIQPIDTFSCSLIPSFPCPLALVSVTVRYTLFALYFTLFDLHILFALRFSLFGILFKPTGKFPSDHRDFLGRPSRWSRSSISVNNAALSRQALKVPKFASAMQSTLLFPT